MWGVSPDGGRCGVAANSFVDAWGDRKVAATDVLDGLSAMGELLDAAHKDFIGADDSSQQQLDQLRAAHRTAGGLAVADADRFTVDSDELDAVIADVEKTLSALQTLTDDLEAQIRALRSVWDGLAADAQEAAQSEGEQGMLAMRTAPVVRLDIDAGGYDTAAEPLVGVNRLVAGGCSSLTLKLGGYAAMGSDDESSEDFVKSYDNAAAEVVGGIAELSTAFGTLATLTAASGSNHRRANAGSVYKKTAPTDDSTCIPGGEPEIVSAYTPLSSLGADSEGTPEFWDLIVDHLQGWAWPSADVSRLREAAGTWRAMAGDLDRASSYAEVAKRQPSVQRSPEITLAHTALGEVKGAATDLAAECRTLGGESCDEYAEEVETTRETVIGLLKDLAIEIGATAVVSGVLNFVTFGGAVVVGAGVATARAIACARRIIAAIRAIRATRAIGIPTRAAQGEGHPRGVAQVPDCAGRSSREQTVGPGEPTSLDVVAELSQGAPRRARVRPGG